MVKHGYTYIILQGYNQTIMSGTKRNLSESPRKDTKRLTKETKQRIQISTANNILLFQTKLINVTSKGFDTSSDTQMGEIQYQKTPTTNQVK